MTIYRRIYEATFGPIPKDSEGRTYEIHHIDGNHKNNDITNLKAVSIQEHYDIHYAQGDYGACYAMAIRMKTSSEELSRLAHKRVENGTHNFLGGELVRKRVADGTHHFLSGEIQRKQSIERVENGTHPFLGGNIQRTTALKQMENGTHNFNNGELSRKRIKDGTHHFLINYICPHCGKEGKGPSMKQWHFDKCKFKI